MGIRESLRNFRAIELTPSAYMNHPSHFALLAASTAVGLELSADPNLKTNLADTSSLPRGAGLAAKLPGDAGLKTHPKVIFTDNFEAGGLGEGWDEIGNKGGKLLSLANPGADRELGQRALRTEAHLDQDTGGGLRKWFEAADTVFVRFHVKFAADCD